MFCSILSYHFNSVNTFRVLGERAEEEKQEDWYIQRTIPRPPPLGYVNEPFAKVPFPLKENLVHHNPHSKTATFIRTNTRFLNKPYHILDIDEGRDSQENKHRSDEAGQRDFFSASYIGRPGTFNPEPMASTYKDNYEPTGSTHRNTRHGSNFEIVPAHGIGSY